MMKENDDPKVKNEGKVERGRCARAGVWYMGVRVTRINENRVEWMNEEKEIVWNKLLIKRKGGGAGHVGCTD